MPLRMWILEDEIKVNLTQEYQTPVSFASLSEVQTEIFEERAAIMEYDGGLSRQEAEQEAMKRLFS
jgi:hypothetical protein